MNKTVITYLVYCLVLAANVATAFGEDHHFNPHWSESKDACLECHEKVVWSRDDLALKFGGDILQICNRCHGEISKDKYIHATGMVPSPEMVKRMPDDYRNALSLDKFGRITCYTCHEMKYQCLSGEFHRKKKNPLFHRRGPFEKRTDMCYFCHDKKMHKKFNPHNQINDEGELLTDVCTYCHDRTPDRRKVKSIKDVRFKTDRYDMLCLRCHADDAYAAGCVIGFESDGRPKYHRGKPDKKMKDRIWKVEKNTILPMAIATGGIFCGTCHNPHELGVQRRRKADVGADSHKRLRISKENSQLCLGCHDKKDIRKFEEK